MSKHQRSPHPATKDLTHDEPEPMDAKLDGYPWLPRMIDTARASQAGTLGTYYHYPCPIDSACLDLLGIDVATFRDIACQALDGETVIKQLAASTPALSRSLASIPSGSTLSYTAPTRRPPAICADHVATTLAPRNYVYKARCA